MQAYFNCLKILSNSDLFNICIARLVQWATQCTPNMKWAHFSHSYIITPSFLSPWKIKFLFTQKLMNMESRSNLEKSSKLQHTYNHYDFFEIVYNTTIHQRLFQHLKYADVFPTLNYINMNTNSRLVIDRNNFIKINQMNFVV